MGKKQCSVHALQTDYFPGAVTMSGAKLKSERTIWGSQAFLLTPGRTRGDFRDLGSKTIIDETAKYDG